MKKQRSGGATGIGVLWAAAGHRPNGRDDELGIINWKVLPQNTHGSTMPEPPIIPGEARMQHWLHKLTDLATIPGDEGARAGPDGSHFL